MEKTNTFDFGRTILKKLEFYEPDQLSEVTYNISLEPEFSEEDKKDVRISSSIDMYNDGELIISILIQSYFYLTEDFGEVYRHSDEFKKVASFCLTELNYFIHLLFRNSSKGISFDLNIDKVLESNE